MSKTQLVLTTPALAPKLEGALTRVLGAQTYDGNWPASDEGEYQGSATGIVQFCHGAPGIVHSLLSIRQYFPRLDSQVSLAIRRGMECTWNYGLLRKEPSLCHGIFGNAL